MKPLELLLAVGLYTSGILGLEILLMDQYLWNTSPLHAFGLLTFIGADTILLVALWTRTKLATLAVLSITSLQTVAMLMDLNNGSPLGVSTQSFRNYLLSNVGFVSLLIVQGITLALSIIALGIPFLNKHRFRIHIASSA